MPSEEKDQLLRVLWILGNDSLVCFAFDWNCLVSCPSWLANGDEVSPVMSTGESPPAFAGCLSREESCFQNVRVFLLLFNQQMKHELLSFKSN